MKKEEVRRGGRGGKGEKRRARQQLVARSVQPRAASRIKPHPR